MRVGVLGGVEEEVLRFVASTSPALRLELVQFPAAREVRDALRAREVSVASFETALDLANLTENPGQELVSAGLSVTLPLGFYSRGLRSLSALAPGSRVLLPEEPQEQGRALLVLYHYGLLGFSEELGPRARLRDVTTNSRRLELVALPREARSKQPLGDALLALDYPNATRRGLAPARHALALEDGFSPFAQVLTVRREAAEPRSAWLGRFLAAYHSAAVKDFILRRFEDSVRRAW